MSSPGGGFYKYRCKYFYSNNCKNWVWVNDTPCSTCLAEGRQSEQPSSYYVSSRDIIVPNVSDGILQYTVMELTSSGNGDDNAVLRVKATVAPPSIPVTTVTPRTSGIFASTH